MRRGLKDDTRVYIRTQNPYGRMPPKGAGVQRGDDQITQK